jgi:perosamine synthetase
MIPVNEPHMPANAESYVLDCIKTGWISSAGSYIERFEKSFADYFQVPHAITVSNGTTALHVAIAALGIGPGDEVILPDLTIISCPLAIHYVGAVPVVVDVEPTTGNIDPKLIEQAITKKTKAIMVVHLYGHPVDMDPILAIAKKHHLFVIEDAAEAHGALYKGKPVGGLGDVGCFSLYGNKIVTTGEGGMVITKSDTLNAKIRLLKDLAHMPGKRFYHEEVGFNYRMTNLQAALGVAGMEEIEWAIQQKREMAAVYTKGLSDCPYLELPIEESYARSVYWMYALTVTKKSPITKDAFRKALKDHGVDTRDYFVPIHRQPVFTSRGYFPGVSCPVSDDLSNWGLYIPSGLAITTKQQQEVIAAIHDIFAHL